MYLCEYAIRHWRAKLTKHDPPNHTTVFNSGKKIDYFKCFVMIMPYFFKPHARGLFYLCVQPQRKICLLVHRTFPSPPHIRGWKSKSKELRCMIWNSSPTTWSFCPIISAKTEFYMKFMKMQSVHLLPQHLPWTFQPNSCIKTTIVIQPSTQRGVRTKEERKQILSEPLQHMQFRDINKHSSVEKISRSDTAFTSAASALSVDHRHSSFTIC